MLTIQNVLDRARERFGPIPDELKGYRCEVILDSANSYHGTRITTFRNKYPYYIHQDELRHRATHRHELMMTSVDDEWGRAVSSSRAISLDRMIQMIVEDPVEPPAWQYNQVGMQPAGYLTESDTLKAAYIWDEARRQAIHTALKFMNLGETGLHKQWVSIGLIPFMWVTEVRTATDFANYYALRMDEHARIECQKVATMQCDAHVASTPTQRTHHLPFVSDREELWHGFDDGFITMEDLCQQSAAMVARTSYQTHEGKAPCLPDDLALFKKLMGGKIKHVSPADNVAIAMTDQRYYRHLWGWEPLRCRIDGDTVRSFTHRGCTFLR